MYGLELVSRTGSTDPITVAALKTHLREDSDANDTLIEALRDAAIEAVEEGMGTVLKQATMRLTLPNWPSGGVFYIPRFPVQSITSITYLEKGESTPTTWAASNYRLEDEAFPPRVVTKKDIVLPTASLESGNPVTVTFVAGYADGEVPESPIHAIRLLVAHWYANAEAVALGTIATQIPEAYRSLIMRGRQW